MLITNLMHLRLAKYWMHKYQATVKAGGLWVETVVFAANLQQAQKILQTLFGVANVPHAPKQVG